MDHLLIVPLKQGISENLLASLRQAGWRLTVTVDIMRAKQLLQKGDVAGLIMEFNPAEHDPDRLKVLRFVHEFCPRALVILLHSAADAMASLAGNKLIQSLNAMDDVRTEVKPRMGFELYNLSPSQKRISDLVAQAYPNREIANRLKIKEQSVRNELSRIFKKMGVWNRVELALLMREGRREEAGRQTAQPHAVQPQLAQPQIVAPAWNAELQPLVEEPLPGSRRAM